MTYESGKLIELSGIVRLKLNGREMGGGGVFLSQGISPIHTVKYKIICFAFIFTQFPILVLFWMLVILIDPATARFISFHFT